MNASRHVPLAIRRFTELPGPDSAGMTTATARLGAWLSRPVDNAPLALFRIAFGILIAIELAWFWSRRVEMLSVRPIRFPYLGFEWVPLLPGAAATLLLATLFAACLGMALGAWWRLSAVFFTVAYTYSFLVDRAYFNNHFYLICLLGGWLAVGEAHARWSIDALRNPTLVARLVPRWQLLGPALQLAIPYVYGGIAKINWDWLRGEPMRAMLWELSDFPLYAALVRQPWAGIVFAWGGMFFDLLIVPALVWRRTRWPALGALTFFHVTNMLMFDIGIFPWLGLAGSVLFMPPHAVAAACARGWRVVCPSAATVAATPAPATPRLVTAGPFVTWAFIAWFAVQAVLPLRHYLIPGNVGWTREGFYFAWTMKRDLKSEFLGFHVCDPATGECHAVDHDRDLTTVQRYWIRGEPQGIVRYARFLRAKATAAGLRDPVIVCDSVCALNGRPYQYMIDPAQDPADLTVPVFGFAPWIVPLDETAPIGIYRIGTAKEEAVMAVIHEVRVRREIFPERLRGIPLTDVTPPDEQAE